MANLDPVVLLGSAYYVNTEDTPEQVRAGILSMAQAGAGGETASQMDTVLHGAAGSGGGNGINSLDQTLAGLTGTFKDVSARISR